MKYLIGSMFAIALAVIGFSQQAEKPDDEAYSLASNTDVEFETDAPVPLSEDEGIANPGLDYSDSETVEAAGMEASEDLANMGDSDSIDTPPFTAPAPVSTGNGFNCSVPKTCPMMSSCEEAMFYLNTCGDTTRDRDGDGVPCESIC